MRKRQVGEAAAKGAVSAVTRWVVGALLVAFLGSGAGIVACESTDDDQTSQQQPSDDD